MKSNLTVVSGLIDLGRGNLAEGFKRDFSHYIECFSKFLEIELPMVLFISEDLVELVNEKRQNLPTHTIMISRDSLKKSFPFYEQTNKIRQQDEWINRAGWIPDSPQAAMDLYNPFVMSKQFFLNDAALYNPFDTTHYIWIDGGIANTIGSPSSKINKDFANRFVKYTKNMQYVCFPYDGEVEVHGFEKGAMNRYAGQDTQYVARGGVFGGTVDAISEINAPYYALLNNTLSEGLMGTEESLFTILTYTHPHLCDTHFIEPNGLVYKYFDDINNKEYNASPELAIYVLTYNLPKQFKLWVDSFFKVVERNQSNVKLYVVNNSDDMSVKDEYDELFETYGFEVFEFDNIGICDGRHFVAEHFDKSPHDYMIFFEDDMMLESKVGVCKNGFSQYNPDLFQKIIHILEAEQLDYLKLSFTEFFGDSHDNWAWYNVPEDKRNEYFQKPYGNHVSSKKTEVFYTGSFRKLPYAVGEYHYCNWPILFNKQGNRKVFLDTVYEHKYESTWMSQVMNDMRDGKVRAGCLLASTITHNREYHYSKSKRKENKHN